MTNSTLPRSRPSTLQHPGPARPTRCAGGYLLIPAVELAALWWAYRQGTLRFLDLRAALAAREMLARRRTTDTDRAPTFALDELQRLTGATPRCLRGALSRLRNAGFLRWCGDRLDFSPGTPATCDDFLAWLDALPNHRRRVPVPRRILRLIARSSRPVLVATALGVLFRCLYARDGGLAHRGRLKASWIAGTFDVDRRRVMAARRELVRAGWIAPEPGDSQHAQNRWGRAYVINLDWAPRAGAEKTPPSPERGAEKRPPLLPDRDPLPRGKDQDPAAGGPAGVCNRRGGGETLPLPDLDAVRPEDLTDTARTLELHRQAVSRGVVSAGEAGRLGVMAAAEHARSIGDRNPCGLFAAIVGRGLWRFLTSVDEDSASRRLVAHRRAGAAPRVGPPMVCASPPTPPGRGLSGDAELLRAVRGASGGRGDAYLALRCRPGGWTRDRYESASAELAGGASGGLAASSPPLPSGVLGLGSVLSRLGGSVPAGANRIGEVV